MPKKLQVKMKVSEAEVENGALSSEEMSVDKATKIINFFSNGYLENYCAS